MLTKSVRFFSDPPVSLDQAHFSSRGGIREEPRSQAGHPATHHLPGSTGGDLKNRGDFTAEGSDLHGGAGHLAHAQGRAQFGRSMTKTPNIRGEQERRHLWLQLLSLVLLTPSDRPCSADGGPIRWGGLCGDQSHEGTALTSKKIPTCGPVGTHAWRRPKPGVPRRARE